MYLNVIKRVLPHLFIVIASLLYFYKSQISITQSSLNFDESYTYYLTTLGIREFFFKIYTDTQQPLYFLIQKIVSKFGFYSYPNDIRYTSFFFGLLFILKIYYDNLKKYSLPISLFVVIFSIYNPVFTEVSVLARPYTLCILLAYINFYDFVNLSTKDKTLRFLITLILFSLTHYLFIFYLATLTIVILVNFNQYRPFILKHRFKIGAFVTYFISWMIILLNRFVSSPELTDWTKSRGIKNLYYTLTDLIYYLPNDYFERYTYVTLLIFLIFFYRKFTNKMKLTAQFVLFAIALNTLVTFFIMPITTYRFISIYFPIFIILIFELCRLWNFKYTLFVMSIYCFNFNTVTNFLPVDYQKYARHIRIFIKDSERTLCISPRSPFNPIDFYLQRTAPICNVQISFDQFEQITNFDNIVILESHSFHDGIEGATIPPTILEHFDPIVNEKPFYLLKRKIK